ncbi:hypothetical protein CCACVL1_11507 [Corchorus capsularis]|uniref:Uncharacterized protein n=1 Tax=Corchorus capsularis TaxID=210143 RepID=A0A1R3IKU0_COCAP|nr:hypothetical protein CCACVL1_11507 [Corchorus capsularis]
MANLQFTEDLTEKQLDAMAGNAPYIKMVSEQFDRCHGTLLQKTILISFNASSCDTGVSKTFQGGETSKHVKLLARQLMKCFSGKEGANGVVSMVAFGGKMDEIPESALPYPHIELATCSWQKEPYITKVG